MPINFYQTKTSAPCRAVALTAAALGVKLNLKDVDVMKGGHLKPEYVQMNPQHTIPTIDDDGFYLWESRAIMIYLADQYGKDDSLYPKDPKKRAVVNQRLYFDACTLYQAFANYFYPMVYAKDVKYGSKNEKLDEALSFLDQFLQNENYVAGEDMTLADLSIITTISTIEIVDYDLSNYKNISRWLLRIKSELPKYETCNDIGLHIFRSLVDKAMEKTAD